MKNGVEEKVILELIEKAIEARKYAYAPYSNFMVGAAVLGCNGLIYTGCNIENASYGASNCAERTAIFKGISEGCTSFAGIAIVGGRKDEELINCSPCGICRQVMSEFFDKSSQIILATDYDKYVIKSLDELLPCSFMEF